MGFFEVATSGVMLPITLLMGVVGLYWLMVIVGFVGLDLFDIDLDFDSDADPASPESMVGETSGSGAIQALKFFHVGEVPIMILLSIFSISWWCLSYIACQVFSEQFAGIWAVVWVGPSLLLALAATKVLLIPTSKLFRSLDGSGDARVKIVGRTCVITSIEVTDKFGQAQINIDGPPVIIDVRASKGDVFGKGDFAKVISENQITNTYEVRPISDEEAT